MTIEIKKDTDRTINYPLGRHCRVCGMPMRCFEGEWTCVFGFCELKNVTMEIEEVAK